MKLDLFNASGFERGAPLWREAAWMLISAILFSTWLPGSGWRIVLLRLFGGRVGKGVVIKPYVKIKFPWRLSLGDNCWIGEHVWIDNLVDVTIGDHACISQGAYLCTGSHDWSAERFDLIVRRISVGSQAWIGAKSIVAPGCQIGEGAVLTLGSIASQFLEPWTIHTGSPARPVRPRPFVKTGAAGPSLEAEE